MLRNSGQSLSSFTLWEMFIYCGSTGRKANLPVAADTRVPAERANFFLAISHKNALTAPHREEPGPLVCFTVLSHEGRDVNPRMAPGVHRVVIYRDVPRRETYAGLPASERRQPFDACSVRGHPGQSQRGPKRLRCAAAAARPDGGTLFRAAHDKARLIQSAGLCCFVSCVIGSAHALKIFSLPILTSLVALRVSRTILECSTIKA